MAVAIAGLASTWGVARAIQALVDLDFEGRLEHLASALAGNRLQRVGDGLRSCFDDPKRVILCHCGVPPIRELIPHRKGTPRSQPARPRLHATPFPHILTLAPSSTSREPGASGALIRSRPNQSAASHSFCIRVGISIWAARPCTNTTRTSTLRRDSKHCQPRPMLSCSVWSAEPHRRADRSEHRESLALQSRVSLRSRRQSAQLADAPYRGLPRVGAGCRSDAADRRARGAGSPPSPGHA